MTFIPHSPARPRNGSSLPYRSGGRSGRVQRSSSSSASAFTLIEIVISSALMALIIVSAYLCLHAAISSQKLIEPRATVLQNARVALALMTADLRCACPLSKDFEFLGMHRMMGEVEADNLDFATHNYTPRRAREGDYCQVSFYLDQDPGSGELVLFRRRNPTIAFDPLSGGSREEIARGLRGARYEYYDGLDWYDTWGEVEGKAKAQSSNRLRSNLSGMPEAVRITLWFDPNPRPKTTEPQTKTNSEPPMVFQTVARLNLAARSQLDTAGGSDTTSQTASPTPNEGRN
jgi:hypothetical protein